MESKEQLSKVQGFFPNENSEEWKRAREELRALQLSTNLYSVLNNPRNGYSDRWIKNLEADQPPPSSLTERINTQPAGIEKVEYGDVARFFERHAPGLQAFRAGAPGRRRRAEQEELEAAGPDMAHLAAAGAIAARAAAAAVPAAGGPALAAARAQAEAEAEAALRRCRAAVPAEFFSPHFDLRQPAAFARALLPPDPPAPPLAGGEGAAAAAAAAARGQRALQETLTAHLDLVEVALFDQIQVRSGHFFRGLADVAALRRDVAAAAEVVVRLRGALGRTDRAVCQAALRVPALQRRREALRGARALAARARALLDTRAAVPALLGNEDYLGALELVRGAKQLLVTELKDVVALRQSFKQFDEYEKLIGDCLAAQFINFAVQLDPDTASEAESELNPLPNGTSSSSGGAAAGPEAAAAAAAAALLGLGRLGQTLSEYQRRLADDLRVVVKTVVLGYLAAAAAAATAAAAAAAGGGQEGDAAEAETPDTIEGLRAMDAPDFIMCLETCYEQVKSVLAKGTNVNEFLEIVFDSLITESSSPTAPHLDDSETEGRDSTTSEAVANQSCSSAEVRPYRLTLEEKKAMSELSLQCLHSIGENVQRTLSQLLQIRQEAHCTIQLEELKQIWDMTTDFLKHTEKVSGSKGYTLKSTLLAQATAFAEARHAAFMNRLLTTLDAEKWVQAEVSAKRQRQLDALAAGRAAHPAPPSLGGGGGGGAEGGASAALAPAEREAVFEGESYTVVWSCLLLIEMVMSMLEFSAYFPSLTSNVIKYIVDLLRLFNSRSTELVLGAGAIHSTAKLKNISAKHLAVCWRSLALAAAAAPHARAALAARLPRRAERLLGEVDAAAGALRRHGARVAEKLAQIVAELVRAGAGAAARGGGRRGEDWDAMGGEECPFLAGVAKGVRAMHKVLRPQLPPAQLQEVFTKIFDMLNKEIPEHFENIEPATQAGKQRIIDEISHVVLDLSRLKGVSSSNLELDKLFQERYFPNTDVQHQQPAAPTVVET